MDDSRYRHVIQSYDLETLEAALARLDAETYPARSELLEREIERRRRGVVPIAAPDSDTGASPLSRDEGYAGFLYRLPALTIDVVLVYVPLGMAFDLAIDRNLLWGLCVLPFVFPAYMIGCTAWRGMTVGRWLMGIMVIDGTRSPPSPGRSLERHLPDLLFAAAMASALAVNLLSGMHLSAHLSGGARVASFHFQFPLWDTLDDLWNLWIWSEVVLLCLDPHRRSLHEFISGTLVVHRGFQDTIELRSSDPSWYDRLARAFGRDAGHES